MVRERARARAGEGGGKGEGGGGKGAGREEEEQNRVRRGCSANRVSSWQSVSVCGSEQCRGQSPATTTSTDGASERRCYIRHGTTASARYFIPSSLSPRNLQQP